MSPHGAEALLLRSVPISQAYLKESPSACGGARVTPGLCGSPGKFGKAATFGRYCREALLSGKVLPVDNKGRTTCLPCREGRSVQGPHGDHDDDDRDGAQEEKARRALSFFSTAGFRHVDPINIAWTLNRIMRGLMVGSDMRTCCDDRLGSWPCENSLGLIVQP